MASITARGFWVVVDHEIDMAQGLAEVVRLHVDERDLLERAELVGGVVRVVSAPGSGTTIVLEVPIA